MLLFQILQRTEKLRIGIVADAPVVTGDLNRFHRDAIFFTGGDFEILRIQVKFTLRIKTQIAAFNQRRMHDQAAAVTGDDFFRFRQIIADDLEISIIASLLKPAFGDFAPEYFRWPHRKTQVNIDPGRTVYAVSGQCREFGTGRFLKTEILVTENHPAVITAWRNIACDEVIISFGNPDIFFSIIIEFKAAVLQEFIILNTMVIQHKIVYH